MELDHVPEDAVVSKLDELGEDILIEILSRLPAKTLFELKSVCVHWNEIISSRNPLLVSMHLRNYTNNRDSASDSEFIVYQVEESDSGSFNKIMHLNPYSDGDASSQIVYIQLPECAANPYSDESLRPRARINILSGPCNGIFLLGYPPDHASVLALWNPATGSFRELPAVPKTKPRILPPGVGLAPWNVGFGVDTVANDLKVVFIQQFFNDQDPSHPFWLNNSEFPIQVMMYTLGTDTWKELEDFPREAEIRCDVDCYRCSNRFGFWLCESPVAVLAFDFTNEVFRVMNDPVPLPLPDQNVYCYFEEHRIKKIVAHGDSVALFARQVGNPDPDKFDVWFLNEEEWRWVKQSTVVRLDPHEMVVGGWREGKLVVYHCDDAVLRLFDPATKATKTLLESCSNHDIGMFVYKDSLVAVGDEFRRIRVARNPLELRDHSDHR